MGALKPAEPSIGSAGPDDPDLSSSVRSLWRASGVDPEATTGYHVARVVLADSVHSRYGGGRARGVEVGDPPGPIRRRLDELVADVRTLWLPQPPGMLDGRKLVFGLALLDRTLRERLSQLDFLKTLGQEIDLHANLSKRGKALYLPDAVPTLSDQPSEIDRLGRKAFAEALGSRVHDEYQRSIKDLGRAESFMLHLEGPWGSGKTSLLGFLRRDLEAREPPWLVVEFNAWQHQRAGAPWWLLMAAVQRQGLRNWRRPFRVARLAVGALLWRAWLAKYWLLLLAAAGAGLAAMIVWQEELGRHDIGKLAATVGAIVGVVVSLSGLFRSFAGTNAGGADTFVRQTRDPMKRLQRRFNRIVRGIGQPIAVFIDDLDRCRAEHVDLLEGIQTLLRDAPVTFVVAADRHWLYESYAQVYDKYERDDPGRPLGHFFLEKTFQLSTSLPRLSQHDRDEYWRALIFPREEDPKELAELERRIEAEFANAITEPDVMARVDGPPGADRLERRLRREAAVRRLGSPELLRHTEHTLSRFAGLLEPNPRAMKRLVNAYGVERAVQILEGHSQDLVSAREKLALWTIVRSRWPLLAEYLSEDLDRLAGRLDALEQSHVPDELRDDKRWPNVAALFDDNEVRRVFAGEGLDGVELDEEAVRFLVCGPSTEAQLVHG
jgi:KAP family P-loop domain